MYWTDWTVGAVLVANKFNGNGMRILIPSLQSIMDLKVMYPTAQQGRLLFIQQAYHVCVLWQVQNGFLLISVFFSEIKKKICLPLLVTVS